MTWINSLIAPYKDDAQTAIIALFEGIARRANEPSCHGCTFLVAASEFPDVDHAAHQIARQYKQAMLDLLHRLTQQAGAADPQMLAEQLFLLMDGVWAAARVFGPHNPSQSVVSAVRVLLTSATQG
ncbi:MAG: hypothetical protein HC794_03110 [Nitrospiraceae bacterium]|nr:hypothetical protein [Nitrospiraceae bacterium]